MTKALEQIINGIKGEYKTIDRFASEVHALYSVPPNKEPLPSTVQANLNNPDMRLDGQSISHGSEMPGIRGTIGQYSEYQKGDIGSIRLPMPDEKIQLRIDCSGHHGTPAHLNTDLYECKKFQKYDGPQIAGRPYPFAGDVRKGWNQTDNESHYQELFTPRNDLSPESQNALSKAMKTFVENNPDTILASLYHGRKISE